MRYAYPMDRPMRYIRYTHTDWHRGNPVIRPCPDWGLSALCSAIIRHFVCEPPSSLIFRDCNPVTYNARGAFIRSRPSPLLFRSLRFSSFPFPFFFISTERRERELRIILFFFFRLFIRHRSYLYIRCNGDNFIRWTDRTRIADG